MIKSERNYSWLRSSGGGHVAAAKQKDGRLRRPTPSLNVSAPESLPVEGLERPHHATS
jgi:hypothetical protein